MIPIWKAAAPALDLVAPDIYMSDSPRYLKILDLYHRPDNALFVPETGNAAAYARYFFSALGRQAIGFAPFGIDYTGYTNAPLGASRLNEEALAPFALNYRLLGPMDREIARLNFEGKLQAVAEEKDKPSQTLPFGPWDVVVSYGLPQFGPGNRPPGNPEPTGRALTAQLAENRFLVGVDPIRIWNGDQTDWGLSFSSAPQVLRVSLGTY